MNELLSQDVVISTAARRIVRVVNSYPRDPACAVQFLFDLEGRVLESHEFQNLRPFDDPGVPAVQFSSTVRHTWREVQLWLDATRDAATVEDNPYATVEVLVRELVELRSRQHGVRTRTLADEVRFLREVEADLGAVYERAAEREGVLADGAR